MGQQFVGSEWEIRFFSSSRTSQTEKGRFVGSYSKVASCQRCKKPSPVHPTNVNWDGYHNQCRAGTRLEPWCIDWYPSRYQTTDHPSSWYDLSQLISAHLCWLPCRPLSQFLPASDLRQHLFNTRVISISIPGTNCHIPTSQKISLRLSYQPGPGWCESFLRDLMPVPALMFTSWYPHNTDNNHGPLQPAMVHSVSKTQSQL
jgi:hypothetical protein